MGAVLDHAERAWRGEVEQTAVRPGVGVVALEVLGDDLAFMHAFANATVIRTGDGLVLLDTSSMFHAAHFFRDVRRWTDDRVHTAVYTHGHVDHVFGIAPFEAEQARRGWDRICVLAHTSCRSRFDRYKRTNGYNAVINQRQFGFPAAMFPSAFRYPDEDVASARALEIGGVEVSLFHDKGETDDHLWAWLPAQRAVVTGDLFIWASPNCGNPQKVQRYPWEWSVALRKMAALAPALLLPGHGPPIVGEDRVRTALTETAELLETLVEQTLALMNQGASLDDVLHGVSVSPHLLARPYLRATYDDPQFIARNIWRLYGGWYDGNPAHLKPGPERELASAVAALVGGASTLADAALAHLAEGRLALATHFAEWASRVSPDDPAIHKVRAEVYHVRASRETSLMAQGIFGAAERDSLQRADPK